MSTQCRHFVQNAWKKELCSNCFKGREDHAAPQEAFRPIVARTANNVKRVAHKVQGILRPKENNGNIQVRSKRKNVAFPDSLAEIIGYDGGDDFASDEEYSFGSADDPDSFTGDSSLEADDLPDSEEERALGNLTRANTNFNTVTANLTNTPEEPKTPVKNFSALMLGRAQKDGDGRKTTLLVSVKPFGGDDSLPTARRPNDKKSPEIAKPKANTEISDAKVELSVLKPIKKPIDDKPSEAATKSITTSSPTSLGKIVDMPLITSTNLMSVMREDPHKSFEARKKTTAATTTPTMTPTTATTTTTMPTSTAMAEQRRVTNIARTPAIKKSENEKPRIVPQPSVDHNATRNHKNLEISKGVELNLAPIGGDEDRRSTAENSSFAKEITNYKSNMTDLTERKVEGEAANEKYPFEESRESAGEPDGKADEELVADPTASSKDRQLAEPRTSFLHGTSTAATSESKSKPSVPLKPVVGSSLASILSENRAYEFRIGQRANGGLPHARSEGHLCETGNGVQGKAGPNSETRKSERTTAESCGQLNHSDLLKSTIPKSSEKDEQTEEELDAEEDEEEPRSSSSKRRMAPQPPNSPEDSSANLFLRNSTPGKVDCPVTREKEKRERASSCSPKFRKTVCETPDPCSVRPPEPAPRRNMSLSQDSLAAGDRLVEEKKKARSKFSLKKFLRMGSRKDVDMTGGSSGSRNDEIPSTPQPKPRLEIIHPLELDGAAVQVLRNEKTSGEDTTDSKTENQSNGWQNVHVAQHVTTRPSKPPPPPRTQSLEESSRASGSRAPQQPNSGASGGNKTPGGKSWQPNSGSSASDSIYANLGPAAAEDVAGAIRSALAPVKPRRTSSMRDQPVQPNCPRADEEVGQPRHRGLPDIQRPPASDSSVSSESQACEYLSSSTECDDSSLELRHGGGNHPVTKRQSDSVALEIKFQQPLFARSSSLPYCVGETENELCSPFGYARGDEGFDDERNWKKDEESRIGRLRQRRGRSIVHRSLEDNYGAVIIANHEALAQFLEQTNQAGPVVSSLRGLNTANLQFSDFGIDRSSALVTGRRIFFSAVWNEQNVTVCVAFDPGMHISRKEFYLVPIVEFIDSVPKDIAEMGHFTGRKTAEATISVLPRLQVNTLKSFAETLTAEANKDENATRESSFVLLQLVSALKSLQARGIEEAPKNLANVVLCRENKDAYHRLYLFQRLNVDSSENDEDKYVSLCQCALNALEELNLAKKLPLIQELLMREKAITLSQVKSILEFSLWGPADATLGGPRERETVLQRWLDLERATVLHALVRARAQLTVIDEYQLLFLVRTSAKMMCEASLQLDRQRTGLITRPSC